MNAQHIGTSLEDFLTEEDLLQDATVIAVKRSIAWQIKKEMELQSITKTNLTIKVFLSSMYMCQKINNLIASMSQIFIIYFMSYSAD